MKILKLQAENFKRLVVVDIEPDGNMVQITGANGQGKTSVLDSIWAALDGAKNIQSVPIRDGCTEARIRVTLGDRRPGNKLTDVECIVTRSFKLAPGNPKGYTTQLKVEGNAPGTSPQDYLDGLLSDLTFDPTEFLRMRPDDQFNLLRSFVPNVDFDAIDKANALDFSNRTELNRKVEQTRNAANKIVIPPDASIVRVDDAALLQQLTDAGAKNAEVSARAQNRARVAQEIQVGLARIEDLKLQIVNLETEVQDKQRRLNGAEKLPELVDVQMLQRQIEAARIANTQFEQRELKAKYDKMTGDLQREADALTEAIKKRTDEKNAAIAKAGVPVSGVSFGDKVVLYKGLPLNQASDAEQLRVSAETAMAKNPKLRIIRLRQASLIDTAGKRMIAEIAQEKDFDIWAEVVDESGKIGFVLEDGHARHADPSVQSAPPAAATPPTNGNQPTTLPVDVL